MPWNYRETLARTGAQVDAGVGTHSWGMMNPA
jgi:hypothetical protein